MKEIRKILIFFLLAVLSFTSGCAWFREYQDRDANAELPPAPKSSPYLPRLESGDYGSWTVH
jgi:hypothetical protein